MTLSGNRVIAGRVTVISQDNENGVGWAPHPT